MPGSDFHACTASVIHSPTRDLIITAAHCVFGTGTGYTFAPGSVNGSAPRGRWTVTAAYVDPGWRTSRNPLKDVAILRVAAQPFHGAIRTLEQVTPGNRLTASATGGKPIGAFVVPAFLAGVAGRPVACLVTGYRRGAYSVFDCNGYPDGVSGAPFIQGVTVIGVIGGLDQGGCTPSTSYSAPFDAQTLQTLHRAVRKLPPDVLPALVAPTC